MKDKLKGAVDRGRRDRGARGRRSGDRRRAGGGGDDDATDKPITGPALDRAKAVALAHIGGGKVTGTEVGDEEGAYEVEVTRADGSQVDVHLDKAFKVIDQSADGADGDEGGTDTGADAD